jgi:hypothetical protein
MLLSSDRSGCKLCTQPMPDVRSPTLKYVVWMAGLLRICQADQPLLLRVMQSSSPIHVVVVMQVDRYQTHLSKQLTTADIAAIQQNCTTGTPRPLPVPNASAWDTDIRWSFLPGLCDIEPLSAPTALQHYGALHCAQSGSLLFTAPEATAPMWTQVGAQSSWHLWPLAWLSWCKVEHVATASTWCLPAAHV